MISYLLQQQQQQKWCGRRDPSFHILHGMRKISAFSFTSSHALLYLQTILASILVYVMLCYGIYKDGCGVTRKAQQIHCHPRLHGGLSCDPLWWVHPHFTWQSYFLLFYCHSMWRTTLRTSIPFWMTGWEEFETFTPIDYIRFFRNRILRTVFSWKWESSDLWSPTLSCVMILVLMHLKCWTFNEARKWLVIAFCVWKIPSHKLQCVRGRQVFLAKVSWDVARWYIVGWCLQKLAMPHTTISWLF